MLDGRGSTARPHVGDALSLRGDDCAITSALLGCKNDARINAFVACLCRFAIQLSEVLKSLHFILCNSMFYYCTQW